MEFLKGKRTYIVIAAFVVLAILTFSGVFIPEWIYGALTALGLGFIRAGIQAVSGNKGWKTYAAAGAVGLISLGDALNIGFIVQNAELIYTLCTAFGVIGVRDAVKKLK
jgi:hypothetical protein